MSAQKYTPLAADPGTAHTCPCGTTRQPHWSRRRSVWLLTALCLETLLLLGVAYYAALAFAPSSSHRGNSTGLLDPQSFLPPIPLQTVIFEDGTPYRDIGPAGDKLWNDMMPKGKGFLRVPNARLYDLPPSKLSGNGTDGAEEFSVSLTHQLHCLAMLRDVIVQFGKGSASRFWDQSAKGGDGHAYHCLDYIRQGILCAGDTSLEFVKAEYDDFGNVRSSSVDGAGVAHVCRDWGVVREALEERRVDDQVGIL
ncbi:hypothetical protein V496_08914 [Pseudogymnoascus sp. VKM F-4515 (FW-2607)]|nr:hypothetical protein V496_08914 [Pseudogymnoascus sp. VKM F-4515 (FW-2607)]